MPGVRHLAVRDLREVLRKGVDDFAACRSDVAFLALLYPVIGILLVWMALDRNLLPLMFPVMSGFALVGPVAAVGLYEMSRRRERGEEPGWADGLAGGAVAGLRGDPRARAHALRGLHRLDLTRPMPSGTQTLGPVPPDLGSAPSSPRPSPPAPAGR